MTRATRVWAVLLGFAALYALYCGYLYLAQRSMLFPGALSSVPANARQLPPSEIIYLTTSFGEVEAWLYTPSSNRQLRSGEQAPAVIVAHGNAEYLETFPADFLRFTELGLTVLHVEYPGYGRADGSPSQATITETFVVAYDSLSARKDIDSGRILFFGRSLGGGAVCALATQRPAAGLVLLSTFTGIRDLAGRFRAPTALVRDPFDNLDVVRDYDGPVLVMHGTGDTLVPHEHGRRLVDAAARGQLVDLACNHGDCPPDWDEFWREIARFLASETDIITRCN